MVKAAGLPVTSEALSFTDNDQISGWAREVVATARAQDLIGGYPDGSFRPKASAKQAEAVNVIASALASKLR